MRARYPDREGYAESHGVQIYWEIHGGGDRTVVFLPTWQMYDSRVWKMQVPYFARHFRVVTYDPPGNGRSGRPASGYDFDRCAEDAVAVLDATGTSRASLVCLSRGTYPGVILAAERPERVDRLALIGTPFIYFPLRNHFEQNVHVAHRLDRYRAGTRMDYHQTDPEALAQAIADGLKRPVLYRDVETDGARRAASLIAGLL